jgi:glycerophosphoryl diester phosphodiesterase
MSAVDPLAVLILAHRGLPGAGRPANTAAAVAAAFESGADGVEVDLRLTRDGVLAVSHDPDLGRLTGLATTVAGSTWSVLDAAAQRRGMRLARLEQVLALAAGRRVVLELKKPPPAPTAEAHTARAVVAQLRSLHRSGVYLDVTISSFSPTLAAAVRELLPPGSGVRTALLGRPLHRAASLLRQALDAGHDEVHPHVLPLLSEGSVVDTAHACGLAVVAWTVNRRRDIQRLDRLGVDALITDVPVAARTAATPAAA